MAYHWELAIPSSLPFAATADPGARLRVDKTYGKLPLSFEANQGQTAKTVDFLSRGPGYTLFLTPTQAVLNLNQPSGGKDSALNKAAPRKPTEGTVLRMTLEGANPHPKVGGQNPLPGKVNYLIGKDPKGWRTGIPTYGKVTYQQVYPGIDLVYYGNQRQLEHDFVVAPGADPKRIRLSFEGAKQLSLDKQGNLMLTTDGGQVALHKPIIYQDIAGARKPVPGRYVVNNKRVSFQVAAWDRGHPLVIDPALVYSTYLGGTGSESANAIALNYPSKEAYVTGRTTSNDFPATTGAFQAVLKGNSDAFVAKLNADGSGLIFATYFGGSLDDHGNGISVDGIGQTYVTGVTTSSDFPTTAGAFQTVFGGGSSDGFVIQLNTDGSGFVYSTYLGGSGDDVAETAPNPGEVCVTGRTTSTNFPTTSGAFQTVYGGGASDAFVTKVKADGSGLIYSTYLGGSASETAKGISVPFPGPGAAFVVGSTESTDFPTTPGAYQTIFGGGSQDGFVAKLKEDGSGLDWSTYLGGTGLDEVNGVNWNSFPWVTLTGATESSNFPTTADAFQKVYGGNGDAFVVRLDILNSGLVYSSYLGGAGTDSGSAIFNTGSWPRPVVVGNTASTNFPTTADAFQTIMAGSGDIFVTMFEDDGSGLSYSTYLGGTGYDGGADLYANVRAEIYVTGSTESSNYPTTPRAFQRNFGGGVSDAFVTKLWPSPNPYCAITSTGADSQGRKYLNITTQDTNSGLASINVTNSANANVSVPGFSIGTNDPVVVTATKINPSQASVVALEVRNQAGYLTACDPVQTEVIRTPGISTKQVFRNIPQSENQLDIDNGTPGLQKLLVIVNGQKFKVKHLEDGEKRTLDLSSAMEPGSGNTVKLKARGQQGGTASILLRDAP